MSVIRKISIALAGVAGALALVLVLGVAAMHQARPAHVFDGMSVVHAHIYGDVVKAPQHVFDG